MQHWLDTMPDQATHKFGEIFLPAIRICSLKLSATKKPDSIFAVLLSFITSTECSTAGLNNFSLLTFGLVFQSPV